MVRCTSIIAACYNLSINRLQQYNHNDNHDPIGFSYYYNPGANYHRHNQSKTDHNLNNQ